METTSLHLVRTNLRAEMEQMAYTLNQQFGAQLNKNSLRMALRRMLHKGAPVAASSPRRDAQSTLPPSCTQNGAICARFFSAVSLARQGSIDGQYTRV